jgi:restriction system protein
MRPLLAEYASGAERPIAEVRDSLAVSFALTPQELEERLPSGTARKFANRVGWSAQYLKATHLLERPRRSVYVITERGRDLLQSEPDRIDLHVLARFPEFEEFRRPKSGLGLEVVVTTAEDVDLTPEERIEAAYGELRQALVQELRDRIAQMAPSAFEDLVLDVLDGMGYGSGEESSRLRVGGSGDRGIDGVMREDRLGLDLIYVQAKRWEASVGRPVIQAFVGALQGARASKGIIFTASTFTSDATEYAANVSPRIVLVDGERLADLMIDHHIGVSTKESYVVSRIDSDYFGDDA